MMETMTAPKTGRTSESKSQSFDQSGKSGHTIRDAATALGQGAEDVCSTLANRSNEAVATIGRGVESVAGQIRSRTSDDGLMGAASNKVAESLEYGGKYLEEQGLTGMASDVTKLVRNNPITSLLLGVGLGLLIARATSRHN